jgi:hypothetical protein
MNRPEPPPSHAMLAGPLERASTGRSASATALAAALALAVASLASCYVGSGQAASDTSTGGGGRESGASGDLQVKLDGLPCDVASLLSTYCMACHGSSPSSGVSLTSYSDLLKTSKSDSTKNEAQLALARMQAGTMPPSGYTAPSSSDLAAFSSWVSGGLKTGSCGNAYDGGAAGEDPYGGPHVCTSGSYYTSGEGNTMEPGGACIGCHTQTGEGPYMTIGGTVYPTAHEPARCFAPSASGATVVIRDKNGTEHSYTVNSAGNFRGSDTLFLPFTAKVVYSGKTRAMSSPQTSGDCNTCHTENGSYGAPGRILLP